MSDILSRLLAPSPDACENRVGDETVILHLGNGTYYGLDSVGTVMWEMLKKGITPLDICQTIADTYAIPLEKVENDARIFLGELRAHDIVAEA